MLLGQEIFLYGGTGTSQIINEGRPHFPGVSFDINNNDYVVWDGEAVSGEGHGVHRTFCANQTVPRYRPYNPDSGHHHYTTDQNEYNVLGTLGWIQEGADGYVFPSQVSGSEPLYRLYNPNDGLHHWTMDSNERTVLIGYGWIDEGIACYVPNNN